MFCAMSLKSLQRAVDLADWAEENARHRPFWNNAEYQRRFADSADIELRAAARIVEGRNRERERQAAALDLVSAGLRAVRLGVVA